MIKSSIYYLILIVIELFALPFLILGCSLSQLYRKKIDIGIGPEPVVTHNNFKKALDLYGYSSKTFVDEVWYISSNFDVRADLIFKGRLSIFRKYYLFLYSVINFKCVYIYFTGGALHGSLLLWKIEPFLYKLANIKIVVLAYGADVQDLSRTKNLIFKNAMSKDYPNFKNVRVRTARRIDLWTRYADHVIAGCDWVDYLYHWDSLCLAHFCVDTDRMAKKRLNVVKRKKNDILKIFHAPNHKNLKGSFHLIRAVEELKKEGYKIELTLMEKVSNEEILDAICAADIIVDQLIIGWYGMFALEAMALGKPVICFIEENFEKLYKSAGLLEHDELPVIKSSVFDIKNTLKNILKSKIDIYAIGEKSKAFVEKNHSIEAIGKIFDNINKIVLSRK